MFNTDEEKKISRFFDIKHIGSNTLLIIGGIIVALGIGGSFIFAQSIEKFFWDARTKSVFQIVSGVTNNFLQTTDIAGWQDEAANKRIGKFAEDLKIDIPNVAAIKIFTLDGVLAWTNLKNIKQGYKEPGIEAELKEVSDAVQLVKNAGDSTKQELNKDALLEIWTVLKGTQGEPLGYIEIYFDSSDITSFIRDIQYSIWGAISLVLGIVVALLRLAFRKQDAFIVRQAHELSNVIAKSPVGIYMIDNKGIITTANQKMLDLFSETGGENILGKNIFDLPCIQKMELEGSTRESLLGVPFDKEASCAGLDGKEIYRHYQGTPLFGENGKTVEHVLFMVVDVTKQKELEKAGAVHTKDLEVAVNERTKSLQEKIDELERFQKLTVDREIRMTELKQQIEKMRIKLESLGVKENII